MNFLKEAEELREERKTLACDIRKACGIEQLDSTDKRVKSYIRRRNNLAKKIRANGCGKLCYDKEIVKREIICGQKYQLIELGEVKIWLCPNCQKAENICEGKE